MHQWIPRIPTGTRNHCVIRNNRTARAETWLHFFRFNKWLEMHHTLFFFFWRVSPFLCKKHPIVTHQGCIPPPLTALFYYTYILVGTFILFITNCIQVQLQLVMLSSCLERSPDVNEKVDSEGHTACQCCTGKLTWHRFSRLLCSRGCGWWERRWRCRCCSGCWTWTQPWIRIWALRGPSTLHGPAIICHCISTSTNFTILCNIHHHNILLEVIKRPLVQNKIVTNWISYLQSLRGFYTVYLNTFSWWWFLLTFS
jgi:hypothetical protein